MRVAVITSGLLRTFKQSYPYLDKLLFSKYNCDLYSHSYIRKNSSDDKSSFERYSNQGTLDEFINLFKPARIKLDDLEKLDPLFESILAKVGGETREDKYIKRYISMLYSILESYLLIEDILSYDYIVRIRTDLSFSKELDLSSGKNFIDHYGSSRGPGDVFAAGNPNFMTKYCGLYAFIEYHYKDLGHVNTETMLPHHMNGWDYEVCDLGIDIIRPAGW